MAVRITCINKNGGHHENPYVAISHLNWLTESGEKGRSTREQMYVFVSEEGGYAYVQSGAARTRLIGATSSRGTRYVKTEANSVEHDNLLKLPECR